MSSRRWDMDWRKSLLEVEKGHGLSIAMLSLVAFTQRVLCDLTMPAGCS